MTAIIGVWGARGRQRAYNSDSGTGEEDLEETPVKERFERAMVHVKRGYWDLEGYGRSRVQWVRGNIAKTRQRITARRAGGSGSKFGSGVDDSIMDPERTAGGGEK